MTLKELMRIYCNDVCVYTRLAECEYVDLYQGNSENIPFDLLQRKVNCFTAKSERLLDIEVGELEL